MSQHVKRINFGLYKERKKLLSLFKSTILIHVVYTVTWSCHYVKGPLSIYSYIKKSVQEERERNHPWEGLLAVIKLASRRVHGLLRKTSFLFLTSKKMALETGDQFLPILVRKKKSSASHPTFS